MGNTLSSDTWTELCQPQRNVMAQRSDPEPMNGYAPLTGRAEESTSIPSDCCAEVCTPRRSISTMVNKDRKPLPVSRTGQGCQDYPSNTSHTIQGLCSRAAQSEPTTYRNSGTRRGYAPPVTTLQNRATATCIDSPRNEVRPQKLAQDMESLNPR